MIADSTNIRLKETMDKNLILNLEHLLRALREVQSLTPKSVTGDARTQIELPAPIITRTREEASGMGISVEVLIVALLQVFNDAEPAFKADIAKELRSVVSAGESPACGE